MDEKVVNLILGLIGGGGFVAIVQAILKFSGGRNALNQRQVDSIITRLTERVTVLETQITQCERDKMDMQRQIGGLEAVVARLDIGVVAANIVADDRGFITEWNDGAVVLFGWSRLDALGRHVTLIVPLRMRNAHSAAFAKADEALADPTKAYQAKVLESYGLRRDGSEIPVRISLSAWVHEGKRLYSAEIKRR